MTDHRQAVFYALAGTDRSCERWLYHIKAFDHDWVTFVLDDCHQTPEQVRALLDAWSSVSKARLLLLSRPIDPGMAGPQEENFQEALDAVRVNVEPDEAMIGRIIESILKREVLAQREPGDLARVLERCRGDLHILEFLVRAWQDQPADLQLADVPEESILKAVYARYLGGERDRYRGHIATIAALSQFEIPVESRLVQDDSSVAAALRSDSFVERAVEWVEGIPREFFRYFHSTPARYVVRAAYHQGILNAKSEEEYILDRLITYIYSRPCNLFKVFLHLYRSERGDLQSALFSDKSVMEIVEEFIDSVPVPPSVEWFIDFSFLEYAIWRWEGNVGPVGRRLMDAFKQHVDEWKRWTLFRSFSLGAATLWTWTIGKIDPGLRAEFLDAVDYAQLGTRSRLVGLATVTNFLRFTRQAGVSRENLNAFCGGLDLKDLGERSRDVGLATVTGFLELARQAGMSQENLNAFCNGLDLKDLGERSRGVGLSTVKSFLQHARQAGVNREGLYAFCGGLDLKDLGERSRGAGLATVQSFLKEARQAGVSREVLNSFCGGLDLKDLGERSRDVGLATVTKFFQLARQISVSRGNLTAFSEGLDWKQLGRKFGLTVNERNPLFFFHQVISLGISVGMAREFVEGIGWDTIRSILDAPSAPDVIAALRALLMRKCSYSQEALARRQIIFRFEIWLRSFMERGCATVSPEQKPFQSGYLGYALEKFRGYPQKPLKNLLHGRNLELRHWNILIHNIKLADNELLHAELEPLLRSLGEADMTRLLRDADMLNVGFFASHFGPETGDFAWSPRLGPDCTNLDFGAKIREAPLSAIAYPLFTLRFLGKPEWCTTLADVLEGNLQLVQEKLAAADLGTVEFFLWNLLTARDNLYAPALLNDPEIGSRIIRIAGASSQNQENLVALCGTLHLWNWPKINELIPLVAPEAAIRHCISTVKTGDSKFIRLTAGVAALPSISISIHESEVIKTGLAGLRFPIEVPSQTLAWHRVSEWIEKGKPIN